MTVYELSRDQFAELKETFLEQHLVECGDEEFVSYELLADADELIPDEAIFEAYEGVIFTEDDFFCSIK